MVDKRGASKTFIAIVMILAVIIIGLIIWGVSNLIQSTPDGGIVSSVSEQCAFACETVQKAAFCDVQRNLPDGSSATCNTLATEGRLGVEACGAISCSAQTGTGGTGTDGQTCADLLGTWVTPTSENACPNQEGKFVRKRTTSDSAPMAGQICCYYY